MSSVALPNDPSSPATGRLGTFSKLFSWRRPTPAWWISLILHGISLAFVGSMTFSPAARRAVVTLFPAAEEISVPLIPLNTEFSSQVASSTAIGGGDGWSGGDLGGAATLAELAALPELETPRFAQGDFETEATPLVAPVAPRFDANQVIRGMAAMGATGAEGAIDQITDEILQMLYDGPTLVVWILDKSASQAPQRAEILQRLNRVYEELGVIEASGNRAFRHDQAKPLLTSVMSFGAEPKWMIREPTGDLETIRQAVSAIDADTDTSGIERPFTAIYQAASQFKPLRRIDPRTRLPKRNVALIVFTDEAGDDDDGLDRTVNLCRQLTMPVYVVGVPAPFGRQLTPVKWIDPDPAYDQTPQWPTVRQGPESLFPEYVKLHFTGEAPDAPALDSGFGPFGLTRLCFETGGMYFAVHPNRRLDKPVDRHEAAAYTAFLETFFDPEVMRRYRPDYVSYAEYERRIAENVLRKALVGASRESWIGPLNDPQRRFVKRDEAALAQELTNAQKSAAKLQPLVESLYQVLEEGEPGRAVETVPRWQAGFDLALGRVAAELARTAGYNSMLAQAKRGMAFADPRNNTWVLEPAEVVAGSSRLQQLGDKAIKLLRSVVADHPDTPWALLAQRELERPLGWSWHEEYTELEPPPPMADNGDAPPPTDEQRQMLERKPRRDPPQL